MRSRRSSAATGSLRVSRATPAPTLRFRLVRALLFGLLSVAPFEVRAASIESPPAAVLPVGEPIPHLWRRSPLVS